MKVLYYDCFSGISGDMNLGALIDLGVDPEYLISELEKLNINGYELKLGKEHRKGILGTKVEIVIKDNDETFADHDTHERRYNDIVDIVRESGLSEEVKTTSLRIFEKLANAEAKVHGHDISEVHFHEVGAIDSIIDVVGAAVCHNYLKVDRIMCSPVQVGGGFVKCAHGILPVPAPATAEILTGIPIKYGVVPFETTTPTGAAILAATVDEFVEQIQITPSRIGYGIGQRDTDIPNVLRIVIGQMEKSSSQEDVERHEAFLIECNIDDMNPEFYESVMDDLFEKGALDVFFTPVIMKKSRPAIKISVICTDRRISDVENILLLKTSTFGLRTQTIKKAMLRRETRKVLTKFGEITMKSGYYNGKKIKSKPEYEDCKKLAGEKGVSLKEIYDSIPQKDF